MKISSLIFTLCLTIALAFSIVSCDYSEKRRNPRSTYMGDMFVSRSYQAQNNDSFFNAKVGNKRPKGAIAIGEEIGYSLPNTEEGYASSVGVKNPLAELDSNMNAKAKVLYATFCSICHGENLDGNGFLYRGGEGPFPAKPATLVGDAKYEEMPEGTMFHSIYYGKNLMGSYSSQLTQKEIWMVVSYIKSQQKTNKK